MRIKDSKALGACFIITSCIYPCSRPLSYIATRSIYSPEERLEQTYRTIQSIRKYCANADIILIDNGNRDPGDNLRNKVDAFYYVGDRLIFRKAANSRYKSLGESTMLLYATTKVKASYEHIFKISGRYVLNDHFDAERFPKDAFAFYHLTNHDENILGYHDYVRGTHSTRLYAFPGQYLGRYRLSLLITLPKMMAGQSLESAWPQHIPCKLYYVRQLGVSGYVGVDKSYKDE